MDNKTVKRLAFGVMFNHSFSILDEWGKIADDLLYSKNKKGIGFSPSYFPSISQEYTTTRRLSNEGLGFSLELSSNNLVYTHTIQDDFEKEYAEFVNRVESCLIPKIIEKYELVTQRLGMVFVCKIEEPFIKRFKKKYFSEHAEDITDCRFAIRSVTPEGLLLTSNNDYINKIYTIGNLDNTLRGISFDYQLYFNPRQPEIKGKIAPFFKTSKDCFFDEILKGERCEKEEGS